MGVSCHAAPQGTRRGQGDHVRIATWNVNSIRSRIDRVEAWLERSDVDVLAIQETKAREDQFPYDRFEALGYEVAHHGLNQWNGVAIASRVGLDDVAGRVRRRCPGWGEPSSAEARAIGATCGGIRVWSLYVPNGRALDDPHMVYKLDWLGPAARRAAGWLGRRPGTPDRAPAATGTSRRTTTTCGAWSTTWTRRHVSPGERAAFQGVVDAGFSDVVRPHTPGPGTYTYWDYTQLRFPKRQGMRIDFVLGSPALAARVVGAAIDREERKGKAPSDHAPVVVELAG